MPDDKVQREIEDILAGVPELPEPELPEPGLITWLGWLRQDLVVLLYDALETFGKFLLTIVLLGSAVVALGYGFAIDAVPLLCVGIVLLIVGLVKGFMRLSEIHGWRM